MAELLYPKDTSVISNPKTDVFIKMRAPSEHLILRVGGDIAIDDGDVCDGWHIIDRYIQDGFLYVGVRKKKKKIDMGHVMVQAWSESDYLVNKSFFLDRPIKEDIDEDTKSMFDWAIGKDSSLLGTRCNVLYVS